jgi:hypothetical protein
MKKVISLCLLLLILAGCKKRAQVYENELNGTWTAYKYLYNNIDQTSQFAQQYKNYTIVFTNSGTFTESYLPNADTPGIVKHGSYHFINNYQGIALDDTILIPVDTTYYDSIFERQYTMFDLTGASVQLRDTSSDIYLQKKP